MDYRMDRLAKRYRGLSRVATAINDLYLYGIYPGNFPELTSKLETAKDFVKEQIKETKAEIAKESGLTIQEDNPTYRLQQHYPDHD